MKLLVVLFFFIAVASVAAAYMPYDFSGNSSTIPDPYNLMNYRYLEYTSNSVEKLGFLRSVRSDNVSNGSDEEVDTIGSMLAYGSLPSVFLAFWDENTPWNSTSFDATNSRSALLSGVSYLIERNRNGAMVRSFSLSQASTNTSVGVDWDSHTGVNHNQTLIWQELNTSIESSSPTGNFVFDVSMITFSSAVRGKVNLGNVSLSPRDVKVAIRVSDYQYLEPTNTLSLRVFCAYGTSSYRIQTGTITTGAGPNRVYVSLSDSAQRLSNDSSRSGTDVPVSISAWQILPGLRSPISSSITGYLLTEKFGANWDVLYSDVTLPAPQSLDPQDSLYTIALGAGYAPPGSPPMPGDPSSGNPSDPSYPSSGSHVIPITCTILFSLLASFFL